MEVWAAVWHQQMQKSTFFFQAEDGHLFEDVISSYIKFSFFRLTALKHLFGRNNSNSVNTLTSAIIEATRLLDISSFFSLPCPINWPYNHCKTKPKCNQSYDYSDNNGKIQNYLQHTYLFLHLQYSIPPVKNINNTIVLIVFS